MTDAPLKFHLDHFEGPMDLLIHLLEKDKIDIYDIPIAEISDQYLAYLHDAESMNLEIASSFLLMAANLVRIKVRMLLPRRREGDDGEDPRTPLVEQILEYRFIKEVAGVLEEKARKEAVYHPRLIDQKELAKTYAKKAPLRPMSVEQLTEIYQSLMTHYLEDPPIVTLARNDLSMAQWMERVLTKVQAADGLYFTTLLRDERTRGTLVGCFLALLECLHNERLEVRQDTRFGKIWIWPKDDEQV